MSRLNGKLEVSGGGRAERAGEGEGEGDCDCVRGRGDEGWQGRSAGGQGVGWRVGGVVAGVGYVVGEGHGCVEEEEVVDVGSGEKICVVCTDSMCDF